MNPESSNRETRTDLPSAFNSGKVECGFGEARGSVAALEAEILRLRWINKVYAKALLDIKYWTDALDDKWGDPGERAQEALRNAKPLNDEFRRTDPPLKA